jgi:hypothetical protein
MQNVVTHRAGGVPPVNITAVSWIPPASGVIDFCLPCLGNAFLCDLDHAEVLQDPDIAGRSLLSRFSVFVGLLIDAGVSLNRPSRSTRFSVRT